MTSFLPKSMLIFNYFVSENFGFATGKTSFASFARGRKGDGKRTSIGAIPKIWPLLWRGGAAVCSKKASEYQLLSLPRSRTPPARLPGSADPDRYVNTRRRRPRGDKGCCPACCCQKWPAAWQGQIPKCCGRKESWQNRYG